MAKKKKKSRANGSSAPSNGSKDLVTPSTLGSKAPEMIAVVDSLPLKLVQSSSPPDKQPLRFSPILVLTESDAARVDVSSGDKVFLLSTFEDGKARMEVLRTAFAKVKVVSDTTGRKIQSPGTPRSTIADANSVGKLSPGYCNVFPKTLAEILIRYPESTTQSTQPSTPLAPSTPQPSISSTTTTPTKTLSSSKSKFSFAKGGGGDLVISPSSKIASSPSHRKANGNQHQLWIVPVECTLGDDITQILCRDAAQVCVKEANSDLSSSKQQMHAIRAAMFLAFTVNSHLAHQYDLKLSFQGKPWHCHITSIDDGSNKTTQDLQGVHQRLSNLELDDEASQDETKLISALRKNASNMSAAEQLQLFRISPETKIVFESDAPIIQEEASSIPTKATPSVAGLDETLRKLHLLLSQPLFNPEIFQEPIRPPRGVLLCGPSGTGKSCLAKQIAQDFQDKVHVEFVNCTSIQSSTALVGQAEKELAKIFRSAEQRRHGKIGSLIVLDDIHLICPRRRGMNQGADRLTATILALLDGIEMKEFSESKQHGKNNNVVILGITSNPNSLDPALRRPGRLDSEIEVPLPDEPSKRAAILKLQVQSMQVKCSFSEEEWLSLARLAKGFTGADCMLSVKEAGRHCIQRCGGIDVNTAPEVEFQDMEKAIRLTKPSAIKAVSVEVPQVYWSSIGGMEQVKQDLREAIEMPITHAQIFHDLNIRPPRGVLLYGPPGCSKTLMARALATEGKMNFLAVKGPELLSKWLGESERALASLFKRARLASPSVIFFDEIDAIASRRGGNSSGSDRLLSQLLTEMDGIQTGNSSHAKNRVVVVGATNRPDLLDSALMRPGRMDRKIYVGVPDESSRLGIYKVGIKGKSHSQDLDLPRLASDELSAGLSGAEIVSVCRNAALLALEQCDESQVTSDPEITMDHMLRALGEIELQITPEMIEFYNSYRGQTSNA